MNSDGILNAIFWFLLTVAVEELTENIKERKGVNLNGSPIFQVGLKN